MKSFLICLIASLIAAGTPGRAEAGFPGGRAVQTQHNDWADEDDLTRLQDLGELKKFIAQGHLVKIPGTTKAYKLGKIGGHDPKHAGLYRYARSYVRDFLDIELGALHTELSYRFVIGSLVRTAWYQKQLCKPVVVKKKHGKKIKKQKVGGAVCGKADWQRSLHLTGAAFDISMKGMPKRVKYRLIDRLSSLQNAYGLIGFIVEHKSNDIHVFVRKAYATYAAEYRQKQTKKHVKKAPHKKRTPHRRHRRTR